MIVFPDTNVWLAAVIFPGLCAELIFECGDRDWLISCPLVRIEAHEVIERKFARVPNALKLFDDVWRSARRVADVMEPADDNNRRLLNAAQAAGASLFITGDKRVLGWGEVDRTRIISPRDAWQHLFAVGSQSHHAGPRN